MSLDGTSDPNSGILQGTAGSTDIVTALQGMTRLLSSLVKIFQGSYIVGSFTMAAASSTTVTQPGVKSGAIVLLSPMNSAAATLVGSVKSPYISVITAGTSFTVSTASSSATGSEQFNYLVKNP